MFRYSIILVIEKSLKNNRLFYQTCRLELELNCAGTTPLGAFLENKNIFEDNYFLTSKESLQIWGCDFAFTFWGKWGVDWIGFSGCVGFGFAAISLCNDAALQKILTKVQNPLYINQDWTKPFHNNHTQNNQCDFYCHLKHKDYGSVIIWSWNCFKMVSLSGFSN